MVSRPTNYAAILISFFYVRFGFSNLVCDVVDLVNRGEKQVVQMNPKSPDFGSATMELANLLRYGSRFRRYVDPPKDVPYDLTLGYPEPYLRTAGVQTIENVEYSDFPDLVSNPEAVVVSDDLQAIIVDYSKIPIDDAVIVRWILESVKNGTSIDKVGAQVAIKLVQEPTSYRAEVVRAFQSFNSGVYSQWPMSRVAAGKSHGSFGRRLGGAVIYREANGQRSIAISLDQNGKPDRVEALVAVRDESTGKWRLLSKSEMKDASGKKIEALKEDRHCLMCHRVNNEGKILTWEPTKRGRPWAEQHYSVVPAPSDEKVIW